MATALFLPVPGPAPNSVLLDAADGHCLAPLAAPGIEFVARVSTGREETLFPASDVRASIYMTESRVVLPCTR